MPDSPTPKQGVGVGESGREKKIGSENDRRKNEAGDG